MTDVIVTSIDSTTVLADKQNSNVVVSAPVAPTVIVTGLMGPAAVAYLSNISDIDLTQLTGGATLVYNSTTQKWVATTLLDQQIVESGQF